MGQSSSFYVKNQPPNGTIAIICQNQYTTENEFPNDILRVGEKVKVLKTFNLLQSRPGEIVTVSKVLFPDGTIEIYPTTNLRFT